jgi:DNA-binding transcriptional ArsR family regulator
VNTQCTICQHPKREEIEDALVRRVPMRRIARRYGVSKSAVGRHIRSHVAEKLLEMMRQRVEAQRVTERGLLPALKERLRIERERVETLRKSEAESEV